MARKSFHRQRSSRDPFLLVVDSFYRVTRDWVQILCGVIAGLFRLHRMGLCDPDHRVKWDGMEYDAFVLIISWRDKDFDWK